jgi:hypothetical protein
LYGTLGVEIAEAIARSFGPEQGLYFANGALMPSRDGKVQELRDIVSLYFIENYIIKLNCK